MEELPIDDAVEVTPASPGVVRAIAWSRSLNNVMHYVAGLTLLGLLVLTVTDIVGRAFFNNPVSGTVEVTAAVLVVIVYLGLAHSEDLGDHISVDILYVRVSARTKALMNLFARLLSVVVLVLVTWQLIHFALRQRAGGLETPVLEWPLWPFAVISAFGAALYALAVLNKLVLTALGLPAEIEEEQGKPEAEDLSAPVEEEEA